MNFLSPSSNKSLGILHSLFSVVVIAYFLESSAFIPFLRIINFLPGIFLILFMVFVAKIYFYSGIYGVLIEIASGEEILFNFKKFKNNTRQNWRICLTIAALPFLFDFLVFALVPRNDISILQIRFHLNILFSYLAARWIIKSKYLRPSSLSKRKIVVSLYDALILAGLYSIAIFLFYSPQWIIGYKILALSQVSLLASQYLHFLIFLYIVDMILAQYPEIQEKFQYDKELIFVKPMGPAAFGAITSVFLEKHPAVFTVLKALTPKYYKFREFIHVPWHDRYYSANKLVAITCYTSNCAEAYKIAREFKMRGNKVIMGGPHVTYLSDEALEYCDSVVLGDAEGVWPQVIKDYEANALKPKYQGEAGEEAYKVVHQELLNSSPEVIRDYLEMTHGCKFKCHFCTVPSLSGGIVRTKPISEAIELIEKVKEKYKSLLFIDNNIYADPAYARDLFKALIPFKIRWLSQSSLDIAKNDETLRLAKESGCQGLLFGYEIPDSSPERSRGGKFGMAAHYLQFSKKIKRQGILIKAHYILGHDTDTFKGLWRLWKFCFSVTPLFTYVSLLTPLPGAALYYDLLRENRITNLNWSNYGVYSLVFRPRQMNARILSALHPFIYFFFFLTTSQFGFLVILVAASMGLVFRNFWLLY